MDLEIRQQSALSIQNPIATTIHGEVDRVISVDPVERILYVLREAVVFVKLTTQMSFVEELHSVLVVLVIICLSLFVLLQRLIEVSG